MRQQQDILRVLMKAQSSNHIVPETRGLEADHQLIAMNILFVGLVGQKGCDPDGKRGVTPEDIRVNEEVLKR